MGTTSGGCGGGCSARLCARAAAPGPGSGSTGASRSRNGHAAAAAGYGRPLAKSVLTIASRRSRRAAASDEIRPRRLFVLIARRPRSRGAWDLRSSRLADAESSDGRSPKTLPQAVGERMMDDDPHVAWSASRVEGPPSGQSAGVLPRDSLNRLCEMRGSTPGCCCRRGLSHSRRNSRRPDARRRTRARRRRSSRRTPRRLRRRTRVSR